MERQHHQGSGRERMRGLGGEWYGRDARGRPRHQHWAGAPDRDYSASGDAWDEDLGDYASYGDYPGGRDQPWPSPEYRRRQGGGEGGFSRSQRYRSGGDHSSFRTDSRSGDYGYRAGESGGWRGAGGLDRGYRGDYESVQGSWPRGGGREHEQMRSFRGRGPKNYTRSDDRIREDINEQLMDADDIDASDVSIEVKGGVVTLNGNVEQRWIKHRIEDMADDCSGVKDVRNEIRVQSRNDWPYDKQQVGGGLGSTASSQGGSATPDGVSASSRSQAGSSAH
ncbi:MAG TPA: BON domain-containing protein [Rhodanobacteraceae bacterium]